LDGRKRATATFNIFLEFLSLLCFEETTNSP